MLCIAPSSSGKTWFVLDLLSKKDVIYNTTSKHIYYVYTHYQQIFDDYKAKHSDITFTKEIPDIPENNPDKIIIVLDDLLVSHNNSKNSKEITEWFIANSHHRNAAVIATWQYLFPKFLKTVSTNASYYVLFPMKRDKQSLDILNRQLFPEFPNLIREALDDIQKTNYGFLLIDCTAEAKFPSRLRNFIYPRLDSKIYIPKED